MDAFQFNKIAGAVLGTLFVVLGLSFLSNAIFTSEAPEEPGFKIEVGDNSPGDAKKEAGAAPAVEPVTALLASADVAAGQKVAKKCAACHSFDKGGKNKVGPNLYDVVNRAIGGVEGFSYSAAMVAYGKEKTWTYAELNSFLFKPKASIKGTSMGFAGLKKTADRANIIVYLRSLADTPAALPSQ